MIAPKPVKLIAGRAKDKLESDEGWSYGRRSGTAAVVNLLKRKARRRVRVAKMFFRGSSAIYSTFRKDSFSPASGLFNTVGLLRDPAGISLLGVPGLGLGGVSAPGQPAASESAAFSVVRKPDVDTGCRT